LDRVLGNNLEKFSIDYTALMGKQIADRYHFARRLAAEACHAAPAAFGAGNPPNLGAVKEINNI